MRQTDGSICTGCEYFEHDCGNITEEGDINCTEFCFYLADEGVYDMFCSSVKIEVCKGYKYTEKGEKL